MGEARRRRAEVERLKREHPKGLSLIAIHEAGHAWARFWTSDLMGSTPAEALTQVEMHHPDTAPKVTGADGKLYPSAATTFGPMYSKEIAAAAATTDARYESLKRGEEAAGTLEYHVELVAAARAAGANVADWVKAKMIQCVAGPVAEAKARRKAFDHVQSEPGCARDIDDAIRAGKVAGWSDEETSTGIVDAAALVEEKFSEPVLWNALLALAAALPKEGTIEGRDCWAIFSAALKKPDEITVPGRGTP